MTQLVNKISELREIVKNAKHKNLSIGLVPTMGALHRGHISLIKKARETADIIVVSVYVNPVQFGANEDFSKYPRTLDSDFEICKANGADYVFSPSTQEMYGHDGQENGRESLSEKFLTYVNPPYTMTDILCGKSRVGHFDGVATVVCKLFNITNCDYAFFGQKDAQQLIILKKMVRDLNFPIEIVSCPIVRDENGLALSSRNSYLSKDGAQKALGLSRLLNNSKMLFENKKITDFNLIQETAFSILPQDVELEYFEAVNTNTLEKTKILTKGVMLAVAARVENVRLIDNIIL